MPDRTRRAARSRLDHEVEGHALGEARALFLDVARDPFRPMAGQKEDVQEAKTLAVIDEIIEEQASRDVQKRFRQVAGHRAKPRPEAADQDDRLLRCLADGQGRRAPVGEIIAHPACARLGPSRGVARSTPAGRR